MLPEDPDTPVENSVGIEFMLVLWHQAERCGTLGQDVVWQLGVRRTRLPRQVPQRSL